MQLTTIRVGARGTVVIPAKIRRSYRFDEGSLVIAETRPEGVLLRPMVALPVEIYSDERKAEFLLNSAMTSKEYSSAVKKVNDMGLSPENIPHKRPDGQ